MDRATSGQEPYASWLARTKGNRDLLIEEKEELFKMVLEGDGYFFSLDQKYTHGENES